MGTIKRKLHFIVGIILLAALLPNYSHAQGNKAPVKNPAITKPAATKFGALAVDRSNGFYYGWSYDYTTLAEAESKAIEECKKKGGNCSVVLSYSGSGCAVYRTIDGNVGTAFGWGVAKTKEAADAIATKECLKRSNGNVANNFVWSCNSASPGALKEIYNASNEIAAPVKIGNQIWMNRNLDVATFRNGDPIPQATTPEEWERLGDDEHKPAWCYYNFDPANGKKYGKLYNWYAVSDPRGLAPEGWHVPSKAEFETLINFLGGEKAAWPKLKSKTGWKNNLNGTDEVGFNLLPNGYRGTYASSGFDWLGTKANLWTSQRDGEYRSFYFTENDKSGVYVSYWGRENGFGVRCIKN
jgi:uncharacterized protein (TIGR02145 family)